MAALSGLVSTVPAHCGPVLQVTGASWLVFGLADLYYTRAGVNRNGGLSAGINLSLGAYFLFKASCLLSACMQLLLSRQHPSGCPAAAACLAAVDECLICWLQPSCLLSAPLLPCRASSPRQRIRRAPEERGALLCQQTRHPQYGARAGPTHLWRIPCQHGRMNLCTVTHGSTCIGIMSRSIRSFAGLQQIYTKVIHETLMGL